MDNLMSVFDTPYEASRERFRSRLEAIQTRWPGARISAHPLSVERELTVDVLEAPPTGRPEHVLVMTAGEHGVEAFAGAAVLSMFMDEYLNRLNPENTGLVLVHTINPWGMKHGRRVNENNVDLNRNFVRDWGAANRSNPDYGRMRGLLAPEGTIEHPLLELDSFAHRMTSVVASGKAGVLKTAVLIGQYEDPRGLYYGGSKYEESTRILIDVYRRTMDQYGHVVHLDMHTGYGPSGVMSVVNSPLECRNSGELSREFRYPRVVSATPDEFYSIHGDMIDFVYHLRAGEFPGKKLYAASFEFGTAGDSLFASAKSLWRMVAENRQFWYGAGRPRHEEKIRRAFRRLFAPESARWRKAALSSARRALTGILTAEGLIG